jgi:hypothetical protein
MKLPQPRQGSRLTVKKRPVPFSFWPSRKRALHHALQSILFALDPWVVIQRSIEKECPKPRVGEALACLEQARDFHVAATQSGIVAARPLALYYSFMNLAKAFCLTRGTRATFDKAQHGLSEQRRTGGKEFTDAYLDAFPTPNKYGEPNNFAEFMEVMTGVPLASAIKYDVPVLVPQIVPGHRLWAQAAKKRERFIAAHDIQFWNDHDAKEMWLRFYFVEHDLSRLNVTHKRLLSEGNLAPDFAAVECNEEYEGSRLLCFEQVHPHHYKDYPADELSVLVQQVRNRLWMTVATVQPYRRYYVYLAPPADRPYILPQMLSIYALMYYLGSITRYRPHHYDLIADSPFGARIQEFVAGQPLQFTYLMASEFAMQDVTKPSIL